MIKSIKQDPRYLWPTVVYNVRMADTADLEVWREKAVGTLPEIEKLKQFYKFRPWYGNDCLQDDPDWAELVDWILSEANNILDHQGILREETYISTMWVNAGFQHQNHIIHNHPNSLFSGCLYLQVPENSAQIIFYDPRPQAYIISPRITHDQGIAGFTPTEGAMLIWPSWLQHSTQSFSIEEIEKPRVTLAFNIMIRDLITNPGSRLDLRKS